ncbi:Glycosyl hydrolase family 20, domain 2 [Jiangella sp. DSM 45060]|nr:Glycosyl hydrolase family 20, domain 2 [Jiangella sp. DSM 45060]
MPMSSTVRASLVATAAAVMLMSSTLPSAGESGPAPGAGPTTADAAPAVVPSLQEWTGGGETFLLPPGARIVADGDDARLLGASLEAFAADLRTITGRELPVVAGVEPSPGDVVLDVDEAVADSPVQAGGKARDEVYELDIAAGLTVRGRTPAGVQRGTQTVLQLFSLDPGHVEVPTGHARDWPKAGDRGFMLDAGRHYYDPDYIEQVIRTMAWYKMNTLHLHLTEWNAFRLDSPAFPGLAHEDSYTQADIARFEDVAARYGVEILPEIDLPGHATAIADWAPATKWSCPSAANWFERDFTLNVTKPETEATVAAILDEFVPWFRGPRFHVGTDEYPTAGAQAQCPELVEYAAQNGYATTADVFVDFIDRMNEMVKAHGKRTVIWNWWDHDQDPVTAPSKDIIVEAWTGDHQPYVDQGYDVINSDSRRFYITPLAPPGGALLPDTGWINSSFVPADDAAVQGYLLSRWSDQAFDQPDSYFEWFAGRPQQVLADRAWGGPGAPTNFALEERADAIGAPPGVVTDVPAGAVPVTGDVYASGEPWDAAGAAEHAFDGDPGTFVDLAAADGGYVGLDLGAGNETRLSGVRAIPRPGSGLARMVGGRFQGCADGPDAGCTDLAVVQWRPFRDWLDLPVAGAGSYRWFRYVSPDGGHANLAEVRFLTDAPSDVRTVVRPPETVRALGENVVTVELENPGETVVDGVRLDVRARGGLDFRTVALEVPQVPQSLAPGERREIEVRMPLGLDARPGDYRLQVVTSWRTGDGPGAGRAQTVRTATAVLGGAPVALTSEGGVPIADGGRTTVSLTATNNAAQPVRLTVTPRPPDGTAVRPGALPVRLGPGQSRRLTFVVDLADRPGVVQLPFETVVTHDRTAYDGPAATVSLSVPYPNLSAAFDRRGMTRDDDVAPAWLGGGIDGDGSSISWDALAAAGVQPGGTVRHGGFDFTWPAEGGPDHLAAQGQAIEVGASGSELGLLTTGAYAPVTGTGSVHYTDGTVTEFALADPDWHVAPPESDVAITMTYNNYAPVGRVDRPTYVFFHTVPLDERRTVEYVVLPVSDQGGKFFHRIFAMALR